MKKTKEVLFMKHRVVEPLPWQRDKRTDRQNYDTLQYVLSTCCCAQKNDARTNVNANLQWFYHNEQRSTAINLYDDFSL